MLTAEKWRELVDYDPDTGAFTRKKTMGGNVAGTSVRGCDNGTGYFQTSVKKRFYYVHRLAWLHYYGEWPASQLDHINGDRTDNRIANLRLSNPSHNGQNKAEATARSRTGMLGVCVHRWKSGKIGYRARIQIEGKRHNFGYFQTPHEAHAAYLRAKRMLHEGFVPQRFGMAP